jgi:protein SCO1/2
MYRQLRILASGAVALSLLASAAIAEDLYDPDRALQISQAAVGGTLSDHQFTDRLNRTVSLSDFAGKPLLISMIFTSCHHVCPLTTRHLDQSVEAAREALGNDGFEVLTVGFDSAHDTPDAMGAFARKQGVDAERWHFLSASSSTIEVLSEELGFIFFPTARGFDHINQATLINREGAVYAQVYGVNFELPWLVEPLKQLVLNRPESQGHFAAALVDRIRLFCTVYDPASGRYEFDNSLFFQIAIGFMVVLSVMIYLWKGFRPSTRD